ncbi:hypothetical protein LZK74_20305 (plasmid) [Sinorhizobium meliloti]|nr:hypothetical protein LZK74_20305 [Sinorhizobium meliloti]
MKGDRPEDNSYAMFLRRMFTPNLRLSCFWAASMKSLAPADFGRSFFPEQFALPGVA